jgi:acetate kinase
VRILVVNAGSSSLKLRVIDEGDVLVGSVDLPPIEATDGANRPGEALRTAIGELGKVDAVGHRIVHGGLDLTEPVRVDEAVLRRIENLADLAPLHQPAATTTLRMVATALPDIPHVACFDTAFHALLPPSAATYALPQAWRDRWPLRRFGFHGLSHAYATRRAGELLGQASEGLRLITCHLGAGASLAAVRDGRSVDTTMGFTPLDGLVMATRSGSVDPGLVLWLQQHAGLSADAVGEGLEHHGGLFGLAGTADMREVLATSAAGGQAAILARDVYLHRLRAGIAAMAAALGGLDALVFTGGVGENAPQVRAAAIDDLGFLGLAVDRDANERGTGDRAIGPAGDAHASVLVVQSREDLEIARQVRAVLDL